jgi:hypothetical protein
MPEIEDYAKFLSEAATSETAIVHEFRVSYAQDDRSFHVFFEGAEDRLFFLPQVRRRLRSESPLHCHVCNGKPKLAVVRAEVHELQFDRARYAFFVDRDYDDFLETQIIIDDRTYLTDWYSIESDLATEEAVEILLVDFGGMNRVDALFGKILNDYRDGFEQFTRCMIALSAWIIAMREQGKKPNLNNVNLGSVFELVPSARVKRKVGGFNRFRRSAGLGGESVSPREIARWIRALRHVEPKRWVRGKYDLWFFRTYLFLLLSSYHSPTCNWRIPSPLREDRIFEALGGRVAPPASLEAFLAGALAT